MSVRALEKRGVRRFLAIVVVAIAIWGIILPRLAKTKTVQDRNRWLEERGIDPAAMFYTDLPSIDRIMADE